MNEKSGRNRLGMRQKLTKKHQTKVTNFDLGRGRLLKKMHFGAR